MRNKLALGLATVVAASAIAAPAVAQSSAPNQAAGATIQIKPCVVKHSRNAGGFTYASCTVVSNDIPQGTSAAVQYKVNLKTFTPPTNGTWSKQTGTRTFAGSEIWGMKFAFKGKSVAQVQKSLKVTISTKSSGVTITQAVATAAQGS